MIKYYKSLGKIQLICKIKDNNIYFYDNRAKHWISSVHLNKQYLLKGYDYTQLTLLDIVMLGVPE